MMTKLYKKCLNQSKRKTEIFSKYFQEESLISILSFSKLNMDGFKWQFMEMNKESKYAMLDLDIY